MEENAYGAFVSNSGLAWSNGGLGHSTGFDRKGEIDIDGRWIVAGVWTGNLITNTGVSRYVR